jgi:hypothetical protein
MSQGKRLHLSYERMVMLVDGCPAFKDSLVLVPPNKITPDVMNRVQSISYAFNYNSVRNTEIGSTEYIKHRTFDSKTITNASHATPIVITSADHGLKTGDEISVSNVAGNTAANGTFTITKIDDNNFSLNGSKGNSAFTSDGTWKMSTSRIPIISQPTVSLDFNYLLHDATNERKIGFNVGPNGFLNYDEVVGVGPLNKLYSRPNWDGDNFDLVPDKGDLNFYILIDDTNVRKDIVGDRGFISWNESKAYVIHDLVRYQGRIFKCLVAHTSSSAITPPTSDTDNANWKFEHHDFEGMDVLGFGNCYLSNYSISIAVGSFITCSASYLCSNLTYDIFDSTKDILCPAVDGNGNRSKTVVNIPFTKMPEESLVLRPGDIQVDLINNKPSSDGGFHLIDLNKEDTSIENITFNLPIQRKDINGFGSNYMNDRKMQFPIMCTADLTILTRNLEGLGDISRIFKDDVECDIVANMVVRKEITDAMPGPTDSQGNRTLLKDHFTESKYIIKERIKMTAKNAKLDSESHSFQIGGFARIEVSFLFEVTPDGGFIVESKQ